MAKRTRKSAPSSSSDHGWGERMAVKVDPDGRVATFELQDGVEMRACVREIQGKRCLMLATRTGHLVVRSGASYALDIEVEMEERG